MEQLVQLRDSLFGFVFLLFIGCENAPLEVFEVGAVSLETKRGITSNDGVPFSGIVLERFSNSQDTLLIQEYRKGKPDGVWKRFYASGKTQEIRLFDKGKKIGAHKYFYPTGQIRFYYQLKNDVYHGFKKEWNAQGLLVAHQNYVHGQEAGSQQVWFDNGGLKSNYIIKNGRRYGLLGTKNCINVKDNLF